MSNYSGLANSLLCFCLLVRSLTKGYPMISAASYKEVAEVLQNDAWGGGGVNI